MNFHVIQSLGKDLVLTRFHKLFGYVTVAPSNFLKLCSVVYRELKERREEIIADLKRVNEMVAKYQDKYAEPTPEQKAHNDRLAYFQNKLDAVKGNKVLTAQFQKLKSDWLASAA
jgi:hypothetical protein